ncbi:UDP-N-acetylmuramoyl-L-alanine--D-glutamate ligase [Clostridium cellulovorans]|uniref:UDP-N-acetylmuramoylalanine--D-glutamate ligase n=1 Tax=Clostridium cellulovorans (strain ATCC 35296 / DSM 3052 / OCM 3 / 743B) TaxID=573061 RepID=D9SUY9_CLOC7|nr:UDP-N-acetylmuramoyl-L-alanine--D-glutamate ligase [Clostridium cellulovorans]ADL52964.1 UDP-N-acetylmuramoylalanine/D-glutamate ligase [Clostridium cellulovorans 743B]
MSANKKVFVLGMARSGYEAAKLLVSKGYEVIVNDANTEQNLEQMKELQSLGVSIVLGSHPDDLIDNTFEMIVKNPGISNNHKYIEKACKLNIPVINELELAFRYFPQGVKIIGITGTNGKTTTTTIIYEILKKAAVDAFLMGNIGYPVCSFVSQLKDNDIALMEVSDHQLCNVIEFKTNISVLTNISEAHLDFHGSYDIYKSMKKRIFNHHTKSDMAILNLDDKEVLDLTKDIKSTKKYFSFSSSNKLGCTITDGYIYYNNDKIISLDEVKIKGKHNYENVMAAIAVVKELGIENQVITDLLKTFGGVEHRIEYVKTINNIDFYNDSKATNIKSTQTALSSFTKPTILLLGGLDRGHSFDSLKEYLSNVKLIVAFGEAKIRIEDFAKKCGIPCNLVNSLGEATEIAYNSASEGDVVLLSPACAAWDQFKDFEVRGNLFKEYINNLEAK